MPRRAFAILPVVEFDCGAGAYQPEPILRYAASGLLAFPQCQQPSLRAKDHHIRGDGRRALCRFAEIGRAELLERIARGQHDDLAIVVDTVNGFAGTNGRRGELAFDALLPDQLAAGGGDATENAQFATAVDAFSLDDGRRQIGHRFFDAPNFLGLALIVRRRLHGDEVFLGGDEAAGADHQIAGDDRRGDGPFLLLRFKTGDFPANLAGARLDGADAVLPVREDELGGPSGRLINARG